MTVLGGWREIERGGETEGGRNGNRKIFSKINAMLPEDKKMTELSMGMSGDFLLGIENGSTMVRVGTAIFGKREAVVGR